MSFHIWNFDLLSPKVYNYKSINGSKEFYGWLSVVHYFPNII